MGDEQPHRLGQVARDRSGCPDQHDRLHSAEHLWAGRRQYLHPKHANHWYHSLAIHSGAHAYTYGRSDPDPHAYAHANGNTHADSDADAHPHANSHAHGNSSAAAHW